MKTIYKYNLSFPIDTIQEVEMPYGAQIISAKNQKEQICIWAIIDEEEERHEYRKFEICGTGTPIESKKEMKFIDTVLMSQGTFVFHVFELLS